MEEKEKTYVSHPRQVSAYQWTGTLLDDVVEFVTPDLIALRVEYSPTATILQVYTASGLMQANVTDWLCYDKKTGQWFALTNEKFAETFKVPGGPNGE